jgi:hypothetical protein
MQAFTLSVLNANNVDRISHIWDLSHYLLKLLAMQMSNCCDSYEFLSYLKTLSKPLKEQFDNYKNGLFEH